MASISSSSGKVSLHWMWWSMTRGQRQQQPAAPAAAGRCHCLALSCRRPCRNCRRWRPLPPKRALHRSGPLLVGGPCLRSSQSMPGHARSTMLELVLHHLHALAHQAEGDLQTAEGGQVPDSESPCRVHELVERLPANLDEGHAPLGHSRTRDVLALAIASSRNAPWPEARFGVFRT